MPLPLFPATRSLWGAPLIEPRPPGYHPGRFATWSALGARLSRVGDRIEDLAASSHGVARNLLLQLHRRGEQGGVRVLIVGLADDRWTADTLAWCAERGAEVLDLGLPWHEPRWNLEPHDFHPNADASAFWAAGIAQVVDEGGVAATP